MVILVACFIGKTNTIYLRVSEYLDCVGCVGCVYIARISTKFLLSMNGCVYIGFPLNSSLSVNIAVTNGTH